MQFYEFPHNASGIAHRQLHNPTQTLSLATFNNMKEKQNAFLPLFLQLQTIWIFKKVKIAVASIGLKREKKTPENLTSKIFKSDKKKLCTQRIRICCTKCIIMMTKSGQQQQQFHCNNKDDP